MHKNYEIENTIFLNYDDAYLNKDLYPNFQEKLLEFKKLVSSNYTNSLGKTYFKFGDGDYYFLKKKSFGSARPGRRAIKKPYYLIPHGKFRKGAFKNDYYLNRIETPHQDMFFEVFNTTMDFPSEFVYGLTEINRDLIKKSKFISNPGCYPTSILIPLIPLLKYNIVNAGHVIIDSKSGMSGAGKKSVEDNLKLQLNNNFYSYSVTSHKHFPEIDQEIKKVNKKISFTFVPNILPIFCGLQSNIYINQKDLKLKEIKEAIDSYYDGEFFIKTKNEKPVQLSEVQGTNNVFINIFEDYEKKSFLIISSIDNLIKGAAGQAIQNMNLMFGFKENESLV